MPEESTRVGKLGTLEVHLKKGVELTSKVLDEINDLDHTHSWYVVKYNPNADIWVSGEGFDNFNDADQEFKDVCIDEGLSNADRLLPNSNAPNGRGRVVE